MGNFKIIFYQNNYGHSEVKDFILGLDPKMRAKMFSMLEILSEKGNLLREPYSKYIDDGIFELRCKVGSDITRVMYFFYIGNNIILTNGFVKKTQKTPKRAIEKAKLIKQEYLKEVSII